MSQIVDEIKQLAKEKDAVILAHYYVNGDVQDVADYVGDSFYLAQMAREDPRKTIVFCGVTFMGESASILNPDKTVIVPDASALCPMAMMVNKEKVAEMREKYDDLAVVSYINSYAETKTLADVCVTSSNAVKIVKQLPQKNIYCIPDGNLSRYIAKQVPEKNVIPGFGYCHVHDDMRYEDVEDMREAHPNAEVLAHPECRMEVLDEAGFIGSTKAIINHAVNSDRDEFIVFTESGVGHELQKLAPEKKFYFMGEGYQCKNMKKITLESLRDCLKAGGPVLKVEEDVRLKAVPSLERMLELGSN